MKKKFITKDSLDLTLQEKFEYQDREKTFSPTNPDVKVDFFYSKSDSSPLGRFVDTGNFFFRNPSDIPRGQGVDLFFLAPDEPIKPGDWQISFADKKNFRVTLSQGNFIPSENLIHVIATSNKELNRKGVPEIPAKFLKSYPDRSQVTFFLSNYESAAIFLEDAAIAIDNKKTETLSGIILTSNPSAADLKIVENHIQTHNRLKPELKTEFLNIISNSL